MDQETETQSLTPAANEVKAKQRRLFWLLAGSVMGLLLLFFMHWLTQTSPPQQPETVSHTAPIYDVSRQLEDKSYWMYKSEQVLKEQSHTQEKLQKKVDVLENKLLEALKPHANENSAAGSQHCEALSKRIEVLESGQTDKVKTEDHPSSDQKWIRPAARVVNPENSAKDPASNQSFFSMLANSTSPLMFSEKLMLAPKSDALKNKPPHISHYIPVGSFVRAVLLNGVDVSVGLASQQNPQPLLLRLVDRGNLPNGAVGELKDCRLIGAAHGDYSSERALIRIEKLSCVQKDKTIIETDVTGFVVGTDGKAGLRGPMITRDGELLRQGFISGLFAGLGKAVSNSTGTSSVTPFGTTMNALQGKDVIKKASSEGIGSAFEILSRYAIKRLEQLQPIIQISANREVDVVFHLGSEFGERKERVLDKAPKQSEVKLGDFGIMD